MGAIAGVFSPNAGDLDPSTLSRQIAALGHRGTKAQFIQGANFGFAHCFSHEWQHGCGSFRSKDQRFALICNGQVFNWREIRAGLARQNLCLADSGWGETIIAAFATQGTDCFRHFNGGFGIAIWDAVEQRLTLARDPCGIKQLYCWTNGRKVVFGTEVKAVLADRSISQNPDPEGIANFLAVNRYLFRAENTFYQGVSRIPSGHAWQFSARGVDKRQYWMLDPHRPDVFDDDDERVAGIRALIIDSVRLRLPSGNTIAAALSGGFDSSSIVCVADHINQTAYAGQATLNTFSFDFDSDDADEIELIKAVAKKTSANHHHIPALRSEMFDDVAEMIYHNDGPLVESSVLLLWNKKRIVRDTGSNVLLSGLGGDEVFMGTLHYFADLMAKGHWIELARSLRAVYPLDRSTGTKTSMSHLWRAYIISPLMPAWIRKLRGTSHGIQYPPKWISQHLVNQTAIANAIPPAFNSGFSSAYDKNNFDLLYYELLGGAIPYQDVCSGAFDVDTRFPLLDTRLIEALFSMDRKWRLDRKNVRMLQKRAMEPFLPKEILQDHLKKNFHHALHRFTQQQYKPVVRNLIENRNALCREYLHWPTITRFAEDFLAGRSNDPGPLWLAANLEHWLNNYQR